MQTETNIQDKFNKGREIEKQEGKQIKVDGLIVKSRGEE